MSRSKTYQNLISPSYGVQINVNGLQKHIDFKGGRVHPVRVNGFYSTSDPDIIQALESHPYFNKEWIVVSEISDNIPDPIVGEDHTIENGKTIVTGPTNIGQAKEWLNKNKGIPFTKMRNRNEILSTAKGFNIDFVNIN